MSDPSVVKPYGTLFSKHPAQDMRCSIGTREQNIEVSYPLVRTRICVCYGLGHPFTIVSEIQHLAPKTHRKGV